MTFTKFHESSYNGIQFSYYLLPKGDISHISHLVLFVMLQARRRSGRLFSQFSTKTKPLYSRQMQLLCLLFVFVVVEVKCINIDFAHHDYTAMTNILVGINKQWPEITRLYSIGKSVDQHELWVLEISDHPGVQEEGEPYFKYVGNMHGNEVLGRETLLHFANYLCRGYYTDGRIKQLVDSTSIHIMPSLNPDGWKDSVEGQCTGIQGRRNRNSVDLNRDFPDLLNPRVGHAGKEQAETKAAMDWIASLPFVLSANFHGGTQVVNYPYDSIRGKPGVSKYSKSPDDDVFIQVSKAYSFAHPTMHKGLPNCPNYDSDFPLGITNGAKWYAVLGGMQDFNYLTSNCFEVLVEMNCCKYPYASELQAIWENHRPALLAYLNQVHTGVKGFITDHCGSGLAKAIVMVDQRQKNITSAKFGDYWRLLVPGRYRIQVSAPGYQTTEKYVDVTDSVTVMNFTLIQNTNKDNLGLCGTISGIVPCTSYNDIRPTVIAVRNDSRTFTVNIEKEGGYYVHHLVPGIYKLYTKFGANVHDEQTVFVRPGGRYNISFRKRSKQNQQMGDKEKLICNKGNLISLQQILVAVMFASFFEPNF